MDDVAYRSVEDVDLILFVAEPVTYIGKGEQEMIERIRRSGKGVILALNKADTVEESRLEKAREAYEKALDIIDCVYVSALKGRHIDRLIEVMRDNLHEGPAFYDEDTVTDQTMRELAGELIREQALRKLSDEVPHGIAVIIDEMHQRDNGLWDIKATIICEREAHKGIIIGKGGSMLKRIGTGARIQIEKMTGDRVNLQLFVKVRKDWRDSDTFLKNYGFKDES
jgi:GTP-binding protein Era